METKVNQFEQLGKSRIDDVEGVSMMEQADETRIDQIQAKLELLNKEILRKIEENELRYAEMH